MYENWQEDPLIKISKSPYYRYRPRKNLTAKQYSNWRPFHFATRLKLDGADFFCRQALGAASMSDDLGLPLLAHRQKEWYLEAFFFELMSAYDTLLQELNIVYAYDLGLKPEDVRWGKKIKNRLPQKIVENIDKERRQDWFYKVQRYRNTATHHYTVPLGSGTVGFGDNPLDYSEHDVSMHYLDKAGNVANEDINTCKNYLKKMVKHISSIWEVMAEEFK